MATQVHPLSHTDLVLHTGLGDNFFMIPVGPLFLERHLEEERKYMDDCKLLTVAVLIAATDTQLSFHYALCVSGPPQMWL